MQYIFGIYLIIGIIVSFICYETEIKEEYEKELVRGNRPNDYAIIMYLLTTCVFWPLRILSDIFKL